MKTTLSLIRETSPCRLGWEQLLRHLGKTGADDEPLCISTVLDSNGLDDALWCLRAVPDREKEIRLYAVWCARQVQHLMTDPRSLAALDVAERFAHGLATDVELAAARDAARAAAVAGDAARASAWDAAWASAWAAAWDAARDAAGGAAWAAAWDAAWAAALDAARDAAGEAAWAAALDAAKYAQSKRLRELCEECDAVAARAPQQLEQK